ncbi:MAG: SigE family RNA polymerase sigma factor [Marmoricola sp.]
MATEQEFDDYFASRWQRLVRSAVLLGCERSEAEDLVQSTMVTCLRKWSKVSAAEDRDAYVHRILINTFLASRRRRWTGERPSSELPEQASTDETHAVDIADAVLRCLARLNDEHRTVVVLRYYAHLTEQQMATALGVPAGTVKSRLARAVKALAEDPHMIELRGAS